MSETFQEMRARMETISELADLEKAYADAKAAFKADKSKENHDKYEEAKAKFARRRSEWRADEEKAGRRAPGPAVSANGEGE